MIDDPTQNAPDDDGSETFQLFPTADDRNLRLDKFIAAHIDHVSRTWIQRLIDAGNVTVDGFERSQTFKMTPGQVVLVTLPPLADDELEAENIPLEVVYQNDDMLVINKPAGMVVHPAPGHRNGTLVNALLHLDPRIAMSGTNRPGIVHRLDRETSGLIVVARTDRGRLTLLEQWADRSVTKEYLAITTGVPSDQTFRVDVPIGRDPKQRNKMAAISTGKAARSTVQVVEDLEQVALVSVLIETGRTHQIRVHLANAGYPIVGDRVYNRKHGRYGGEGSLAERQMLHAFRLAFSTPEGERIDLSVPLPADMAAILATAREDFANA
ncbi:MAG TPA: RluA family pseudouridine synthase [Thermomicrobiales bacterium]|nr:RluA family pseudouridine synthase [Thermomicrobiales bacterium]